MNEIKHEALSDDTLWWNKLRKMTHDEVEMMPFTFIKKYGSFLSAIKDHNLQEETDQSRSYENRWNEIKGMQKLLTNEEKKEIEDMKEGNTDISYNE